MCLEIKISTFQLIELHCINDEPKILKLNLQQLALQYHSMQCAWSVDYAEKQ
jgi:hypothetical protein